MSIVSSRVFIYNNQDCKPEHLVSTAYGTTASIQSLIVSGLNANTQYYAKAFAIDNHAIEGESLPVPFMTTAATYIFSGSVSHASTYDKLHTELYVYCNDEEATFTACGIEFCADADFSGKVLRGLHKGVSGADDFVGDVSGFLEHTTYYYRYYANSVEFGEMWYYPDNNYITTLYAEPQLLIEINNLTSSGAIVSITYNGNYPLDVNDMNCSLIEFDSSTWVEDFDLSTLVAGVAKDYSVSLQADTRYRVEWNVGYYSGEITADEIFKTANDVSTIYNFTVNTYAPSYDKMRFDIAASYVGSEQITATDIGIDVCAVPNFSGHQFGGDKGSYAATWQWTAENLNENRQYYYRPWIDTVEHGRQYGETHTFTTQFAIPDVILALDSRTYNELNISVTYKGSYPVPEDGTITIMDAVGGTVIESQSAANLIDNTPVIFTFTGLDEETEYYVYYEGSYYSIQGGIYSDWDGYTDERISFQYEENWALDGLLTLKITIVAPYDNDWYLDEFVWGGQGITPEADPYFDGDTLVVPARGFVYGGSYAAEPAVGITSDPEYTKIDHHSVVVPTQVLTVSSMTIDDYSNMIMYRVNGMIPSYTKIFNYDSASCDIELEEAVSGNTINIGLNTINSSGGYQIFRSSYQNQIPVGTYNVNFTVQNIMQQQDMSAPTQQLTVVGAKFYTLTPESNKVTFSVTYNAYYVTSTPTKLIELTDANDNVLNTRTVSAGGQSNLVFNGLTPSTDYKLKTYYETGEPPVVRTFTTTA